MLKSYQAEAENTLSNQPIEWLRVFIRVDLQWKANAHFAKFFTMGDQVMPHSKPPEPVHVPGIYKGEEHVFDHGREPGRGGEPYRTARDSTGINAKEHGPILPVMPNLPPS